MNGKYNFQIGARIHDLLQDCHADLSEALVASTVDCVQLTLPKFVRWSESPQNYSFEKIQKIKLDFEKAKVDVKVLSCYVNPLAENVKKEQDTLKDMRIVQEMYARGYEFTQIDLYTAQAHRFQIIDGKLMPALDSIEGLGDKAADAVVLAARDGKFLSKDDFRQRTKVSKTVIDFMDDLGIFGDIPESNQFSLFDFEW